MDRRDFLKSSSVALGTGTFLNAIGILSGPLVAQTPSPGPGASPSSIERPILKGGYFQYQGRPLFPVGFNYWPSRSGVTCWRQFTPSEWEEDFQEIARRKYNAVRFFLIWPDFQPHEDRVDEEKISHLQEVVSIGKKYGLWLVPTLFQGWMSGTNFDPPWRKGRNQITDPTMRSAMLVLAGAVAQALQGADNLLAFDLANEIDAICPDVTPAGVGGWTSDLRQKIQGIIPGVLVTNGTSVSPLKSSSRWCFGDQNVDFQCMHGYPVFWNPLLIGSLKTARASSLFGSLTAFAGAYGPVMREEYGTAIGGDGELLGDFIKASTFGTYLAGANGFLYWNWRDISNQELPYKKHPFETSMGYVDASLKPKQWSKGLDFFHAFLQSHQDWKPVPDPVGIYIPSQFKGMGPTADEAMASAYENLVSIGYLPRFTAKIDGSFRLLVLPMADLGTDEIEALHGYCESGGRVIALGLSCHTCSALWAEWTSTQQEDILRAAQAVPLDVPSGGGTILIEPTPDDKLPWPVLQALSPAASPWIAPKGLPPAFVSTVGSGCILQICFPLTQSGSTEISPALSSFWRQMLARVGETPKVTNPSPWLQLGEIEDPQGNRKLIVINHASAHVETKISYRGHPLALSLTGKEVRIFDLSKTG